MNKQEFPEFDFYYQGLSEASPCEKNRVISFKETALLFSTWYLAIRDQADRSAIDFIKQGMCAAADTLHMLPMPSQELFRRTIEMASAFLEGFVNKDDLVRLRIDASMSDQQLKPVLHSIIDGTGGHEIDEKGNGLPRILKDSFCLSELIKIMLANTNDNGLVHSLSPLQRGLIWAFIADGKSRLVRNPPRAQPG